MTNSADLHVLVENFKAKTQTPNNQMIGKQIDTVKKAIEWIQWIIADPNNSSERILEWYLGSISHFFRHGKFTTLVLPVLEALEWENPELWKQARIADTNMPLTPIGFEGLKKSSAEIPDKLWWISSRSCMDRELHLLKVYKITMITISDTIHILRKNK